MIKTEIKLPMKYNRESLILAACEALPIDRTEIREARLIRRSLVSVGDGKPYYKATLALSLDADREAGLLKMRKKVSECPDVGFSPPHFRADFRPVVVGFGPAGIFAALTLAEAGARPIVLERGLPVEEREKRIELFSELGILDTECNVQFGEGGAGTYSDGKLKCGAMDKYKMKVLSTFYDSGADEEVLFSTAAHLGTDRLPDIVRKIRERIISLGGEVIFGARVCDLTVRDGSLSAVIYEKGSERITLDTRAAIFATGHSARDTTLMLREKGLLMEARGFGIGLRIEHPREYIDSIVYKDDAPYIDASASYHLVTHLPNGRSVYSFCMCPGGSVVAATSEKGAIVTNGMSPHSRGMDNSNAALLVSVTPNDFGSDDELAGFALQEKIEKAAYSLTGSYRAPSFRLSDFLERRQTSSQGSVMPSYPPGTEMHSPDRYLDGYITDSLRAAMPELDSWLSGYGYPDAILTGPETRSTSPVRILRDEKRVATGREGIYPAGEGAGYAGGIVSSATDGIRSAEQLILAYSSLDQSHG